MNLKRSICIAALSVFLSPASAFAVDFVFDVPYDIKNIQPEVTKFQIDCTIRDNDTLPSQPEAGIIGPTIASGYKALPVNGKSTLKGTARISLTSPSGVNPADGKIFRCGLRAFVPGASYPLWKNNGSNPNVKGHHVDASKPNRIAVNGKIADFIGPNRKRSTGRKSRLSR